MCNIYSGVIGEIVDWSLNVAITLGNLCCGSLTICFSIRSLTWAFLCRNTDSLLGWALPIFLWYINRCPVLSCKVLTAALLSSLHKPNAKHPEQTRQIQVKLAWHNQSGVKMVLWLVSFRWRKEMLEEDTKTLESAHTWDISGWGRKCFFFTYWGCGWVHKGLMQTPDCLLSRLKHCFHQER